jgi:hypothetical protein
MIPAVELSFGDPDNVEGSVARAHKQLQSVSFASIAQLRRHSSHVTVKHHSATHVP